MLGEHFYRERTSNESSFSNPCCYVFAPPVVVGAGTGAVIGTMFFPVVGTLFGALLGGLISAGVGAPNEN